jgi:predicted enzyme related to lactoylglutathione lyase
MDASGFLPDGAPASWNVYFSTDDADKTLAQVTELGGSIVIPAEDTPYGRLATATDPTGAVFRIVAEI